MTMNDIVVSAPGKVLLLGGYAVLERPHPGLVIAATSRFHVRLEFKPTTAALRLAIDSPQWAGGWSQRYVFAEQTLQPLNAAVARNKYVEDTVAIALRFLSAQAQLPANGEIALTLLADNDFYSQQNALKARSLPLSLEGLSALPQHLPVEGDVAKTGLGSSAAMITSLCGALLMRFTPGVDIETVHRLAQVCHALVQGKIGSGFDVCAACFGSMQYVRYDAAVMKTILASDAMPTGTQVASCVAAPLWNHTREAVRLPRHVSLMCGDVCGGSETPSMSKAILQYKQTNHAEWDALVKANAVAVQALRALVALEASATYDVVAFKLAAQPSSAWTASCDISSAFCAASKALAHARACLRALGEGADVPVEPPSQRALCDATLACAGVLASGVPGAGGFDAVFALVVGPAARGGVETAWTARNVCPLPLQAGPGGLQCKPLSRA